MKAETSGFVAVILAAGKGTRMKSTLPKVLHQVGGKSMLAHVIQATQKAGASRQLVVVGFGEQLVRETVSEKNIEFVVQKEQLGTGHAVLQTKNFLQNEDDKANVMVLCGDTPLLTKELLENFYKAHKEAQASATVLTAILDDATGYGRIVRENNGDLKKIVEHKDATDGEKMICEINTGIYCFEKKKLFAALEKVTCDNAQGEYYLPDVLEILKAQGEKVAAVPCDDFQATLGINSREQLAAAEKILRQRKNKELMQNGVTILSPETTFIDEDVEIGQDTIIFPFTWIEGQSKIGKCCQIGPCSRLQNVLIGDKTTAQFFYAHDCEIKNEVTLGPYVHLRPDAVLEDQVKVGDFVEVKNSTIGAGSKLPHLQYIGDCDMGQRVNMGCGTITVNFDGKEKHRTKIGDDAFVGCNVNLIAPVSLGNGAYIAAGSTITRNVPEDALAVCRERKQTLIPDYSKRK